MAWLAEYLMHSMYMIAHLEVYGANCGIRMTLAGHYIP
jgi:hypothetical protein